MSRLIASLTVKPLLWAVGALFAVVLLLAVLLFVSRRVHITEIAAMQSKVDAAEASRDAARKERDGWERAAISAAHIADENRASIGTLKGLLEQQQAACAAIATQNRQAAQRADAAARRADSALADYRQRAHGQNNDAACRAALEKMEAACPALSGY